MRTALRLRPTAWDLLEVRVLPSRIGGTAPPAITPIERFDAYAMMRHTQDLAKARDGAARVVFLGDSISDYWGDVGRYGPGAAVWRARLAPLGAANFGVSGDTTANVLWRIDDGELAGTPKLVVIQIGTNDIGHGRTASQTAAAITTVVDAVFKASPGSKVLLMGLFPIAPGFDDSMSLAAHAVNAQLPRLADGPRVRFLDIYQQFLNWDGTVDRSLLPDGVHPSALGYQVWANALAAPMQQMLSSNAAAPGAGGRGPAQDSDDSPTRTAAAVTARPSRAASGHLVRSLDIAPTFLKRDDPIDASLGPAQGSHDSPAHAVTTQVSRAADGGRVRFVDIAPTFLKRHDPIDTSLLPDGVHTRALGDRLSADAKFGPMQEMLLSHAATPVASARGPATATDPTAGLVLIASPSDADDLGLPEVPGVANGHSARKDHAKWSAIRAFD